MVDWVKRGRQYAEDVLSGKIVVNRLVKLACQRSEGDFDRFAAHDSRYLFDEAKATDVCNFMCNLPHVQDSITTKAGELFVPMDWQAWELTTLFGWRWRDTNHQRFNRSWTEQGRGNGKSFLSSGVMLYKTFADGISGAQAVCAASSSDQAHIVLDTSRQMVIKSDELQKMLGLKVTARTIIQPSTNSKLWALPARAATAEGLALNAACLDEVHLARGASLRDTLSTGCTKKENSLFWLVTTAGDDTSGVAYETHNFLERVLTGENEDDSFFAAMYGIDEGDNWKSPAVWQKANPSWNICVSPRALEEECSRASQIPSARANFRIKHLSEWIQNGGDDPFLEPRFIKKCYDPDLDESEFLGKPCVMTADLASRKDMCSVARLHSRRDEKNKIHYYVFVKNWLPEPGRNASVAYAGWIERNELVITAENTTDQDAIEKFITSEMDRFEIRDFGFDPIQSAMLINHLLKKGLTAVEVYQQAKILTPGVHELQDAILGGRLHTNSQILIWALGNLRVRTVCSSMLQPMRPQDRALKIDAAIATIMLLCSAVAIPLDESWTPNIYFIDNVAGEVSKENQ